MDDEKRIIKDYEEKIEFQDLLIEALNNQVEKEKSNYKAMEETIIELNKRLEEKTDYEIT